MDNITFKSKINFVTDHAFHQLKHGKYVDFVPIEDSIVKADEFFTEAVRTCSAGGIIDTKNNEAVGFHIFDTEETFKNIQSIIDKIFGALKNPDKCLLLGGKNLKNSEYSIDIFETIRRACAERLNSVTSFEIHTLPWSESDLHYSLKDDTWNIHTMFRTNLDYKERSILSNDDLANNFKYIYTAKDDIINFPSDNIVREKKSFFNRYA